ncbi:MAG: 6-phosphogluconolactonase [Phycisphaerales bacterium]|nr:6-phosphogluconolactonase [Phycisphaerales bacterium]
MDSSSRVPRGKDVDAYEVDEIVVEHPPLPGDVIAAPDADRLVDLLAADLVAQAMSCARSFGDFHLALSGGSTPQPLYERLMYDPNLRVLPWRRTHLWIVDERRVPFDDARSNFRAIRETIVDHSDIPPEQVHPIFAMADEPDVDYERTLRETLVWREKGQDRLDFVLLGMGADGHTASLFPHHPVLREESRLVRVADGPTVTPPDRVTMSYPLLNSARVVAVMVTGASKAPTLSAVASGKESFEVYPIKGVHPVGGQLRWYVDALACGRSAPEHRDGHR